MVEISDWLWETLYTLKLLYDHGKIEGVHAEYSNHVLDGDDDTDIAMNAIYEVFAETKEHWNEEYEQDIYVFFDPIFDEFQRLCAIYEKEKAIPAKQNPHREEICNAIRSGMLFYDYSYEYMYYDGTQKDGKAKLILKLYPEFCHMYEIVGGLLEVYDAFESHVKAIKDELNMKEPEDIDTLKEAA